MFKKIILTVLILLNVSLLCFAIESEDELVVPVNIDNFAKVAFDFQALATIEAAGGINTWKVNRLPIATEYQKTIFTNRDMLYLLAIIDISHGADISAPFTPNRYLSFSIINRDGYLKNVFHGGGLHTLNKDELGTNFVYAVARIMVDPDNPKDVISVNSIQDNIRIFSGSEKSFPRVNYNRNTFDKLSRIFSELTPYTNNTKGMFGDLDTIDTLRFLVGTSIGWGGLPEQEAIYRVKKPHLPIGKYRLKLRDPPSSEFWSITIYNEDGYFQKGSYGKISINSLNVIRNDDDSITVHFGGCSDQRINCLELMPNWSYAVRIYRPSYEILSENWTFPKPEPI